MESKRRPVQNSCVNCDLIGEMLSVRRVVLAAAGAHSRAMSTLWKHDAPQLFPSQSEGNIYADNHSINVDGVVSQGFAGGSGVFI